jgi:hypothetical protein
VQQGFVQGEETYRVFDSPLPRLFGRMLSQQKTSSASARKRTGAIILISNIQLQQQIALNNGQPTLLTSPFS